MIINTWCLLISELLRRYSNKTVQNSFMSIFPILFAYFGFASLCYTMTVFLLVCVKLQRHPWYKLQNRSLNLETPSGMEFNDLTGDVRVHGISYRFRPKTFELLRLLANAPAQVFSKTVILQQIWPDAIVEEQAIFQSINEIRKAFAPVEVIKTYPKKGYAWVLPPNLQATSSTVCPINQQQQRKSTAKRLLMLTLLVLLLSIIVGIYGRSSWTSAADSGSMQDTSVTGANTAAPHSAILVLPFDVSRLDASQHWLKFAGMDALIQQLQPTSELTVFQLADVIDILKRLPPASINNRSTDSGTKSNADSSRMSQQAISQLFQVAGITQIVQVEISGVPGDYQLITTLHYADSRQKSAFRSTSLEQSLPQLAAQVSNKLSQPTAASSDLHSHLLANALELVATQQFSTALPLATSAVTLDPTNIVAHYVLSDIQLQLGQFAAAFATTEQALTLQDAPGYSQYVARLWYQKGIVLMQRRDFIAAETTLQQASKLANQQKDWLYLAYSQAMLAQLKLAQQQFEQALPLLNAALQYQQILHCPQGIAQSELDLAAYLMLTNQPEQAKLRYKTSAELVQQKGLTQLHPALLEFEQRWLKQPTAQSE